MSKWKSVGTKLTEEELNEFIECIKNYSNEKRIVYSIHKFLRIMILSYIKKYNKKS